MNLKLEVAAAGRGGWFSRRDAIVAGYSDADLRRHVASGRWVRITRGAYAERGPVVEAMPPWEQGVWRHLRAARAVYHRLNGRAVVSHQSALLLHGVRVSELDLRRVHVTRLLGTGRSDRAVCQHAARPSVDVVCEMDGVRATHAARAVVETVRATSYPVAVSVVATSSHDGFRSAGSPAAGGDPRRPRRTHRPRRLLVRAVRRDRRVRRSRQVRRRRSSTPSAGPSLGRGRWRVM